jgi:serine phosphatase RsbU (regulator of sigma subunit)
MKQNSYITGLVVLLLFAFGARGQDRFIDSLKEKLQTEKIDTSRVKILLELSKHAYLTGELDTALKVLQRSLTLSEKINFKSGKAYSYGIMVNVYIQTGSYPEAIRCGLLSLQTWEEQKNKKRMAISYNNLAVIYQDMHNYNEASKYVYKALELSKEIGDKTVEAASYNNFGIIYDSKKDHKKALEYYELSLKIKREMGNKGGMGNTYASIGIVYTELKQLDKALECHLLSLDLRKAVGDKFGIASSLINMASTYNSLNKPANAKRCLDEAVPIVMQMQSKEAIYAAYAERARFDSITGNFKSAFFNYKLAVKYRDSLRNEEATIKSTRDQMQFDFDKRTAADSVAFAKQKEIDNAQIAAQNAEIRAKRNSQYILFGGLGLVLIFTVFIYNRFKITQRQKSIIESQKSEVEHQKLIIEESKKDITDSINYALRIQKAILPPAEFGEGSIGNGFILFKPKDIVSGDFYWYTQKNGKTIIAATDCTGHGVPGAFMSMLGITFLNEIVNEKNITTPFEILGHLRDKIKSTLKQQGAEGENKDGMDIALISIDEKNNTLEFAGANNPLWIFRDEKHEVKFIELAPDKRPIGYFKGMGLPFTNQTFEFRKDDRIYIFTDGYADQFGGPKGKKFKYKQLSDLLASMGNRNMMDQKELLTTVFDEWKGKLDQVDDVCVIGIKT